MDPCVATVSLLKFGLYHFELRDLSPLTHAFPYGLLQVSLKLLFVLLHVVATLSVLPLPISVPLIPSLQAHRLQTKLFHCLLLYRRAQIQTLDVFTFPHNLNRSSKP